MIGFSFQDVLASLHYHKDGIPVERLTARIRLGEHRSCFFGPSYDFFDIQEYDPERDPPNMVLHSVVNPADESIIYSRKTIEPHDVQLIFLADLSSSIDAGYGSAKRRLLLEAIGFIGLTAVRYQDVVGLAGFTDKVVLNLPAKSGKSNFHYLLQEVYDFLDRNSPDGKNSEPRKTDFYSALNYINRGLRRGCLIPIISDFVGFEEVVNTPLFREVAAKHELILIFLDDPQEFIGMGGVGFVRVRDAETGKRFVVSRRKMRRLEKETREKRKKLRADLRRLGVHSVVLEQNGRHFGRLQRFFISRQKTIRA